jgi:hypothetical protein
MSWGSKKLSCKGGKVMMIPSSTGIGNMIRFKRISLKAYP